MAENATLFWSYTEIQNAMRWYYGIGSLSLGQLACAGAGAGAITSFVLCVAIFSVQFHGCFSTHLIPFRTPIELVKCKMQVQMLMTPTAGPTSAPRKLPGPIAVLTSVVRETGLRGLWLGHTGTCGVYERRFT